MVEQSQTCPLCDGFGVAIHPAWAAFYANVRANPFQPAWAAEAWWRANDCPQNAAGNLMLPPQEVPCPCRSQAAA
jgi:hypothetical protein